jgi:hypothetical protein
MPKDPSLTSSPVLTGYVLTGNADGSASWQPGGAGASQVFTFDAAGTSVNAPGVPVGTPRIATQGGSLSRCDVGIIVNPGYVDPTTGTAPTVTIPLVVDVQKSTDGGNTWATLWPTNPSNRPTVAIGAFAGFTTAFDVASYNAGDQFAVAYMSGGFQLGGATYGNGIGYAEFTVTLR